MSASRSAIEDAVIKGVAQRKRELEERAAKPPDPPAQNSKRRGRTIGKVDPPEVKTTTGTHQVQRMVPPTPAPGMLNQEMAEAAAAKYKKDKKKIQKACAEVDGTAQQGCSCVIL